MKTGRKASPFKHCLLVLVAIALLPGCDSANDPPPDDPTANLSGVVRDSRGSAPLAGVVVRVGALQTTTGSDGRYEFRDMTVGWATLEATATGYNAYSELLSLNEGNNDHDVVLEWQTLFEHELNNNAFTLYVPRDVAALRAALFVVAGQGGESRRFVRGQFDEDPAIAAIQQEQRQQYLELADKYGLVVLGEDSRQSGHASRTAGQVLAAMEVYADATGHPELELAPLLLWGYSLGGCFSYDFASQHADRVVGFITQKGGCHSAGDRGPSKSVPGYLFIGNDDTIGRIENISGAFMANRAAGALWALGIDIGAGHEPVEAGGDIDLVVHWMDAVLSLRLPASVAPGSPVDLRPINQESGWLGNRSTFEIGSYDCYDGEKQEASWLPSFETAQEWQAFSSEGRVTTVITC